MARFAKHIVLYFLLAVFLLFAIPFFFAGPFTDPFYLRFTTGKKRSLVIGTSRAAQGIIPDVMKAQWKEKDVYADLYNYSFTIKSSPFGKPYLESVLRKIDVAARMNKQENLFIVAVDPWSISTLFAGNGKFEEENFAPNNMRIVDLNPNPEYIFRNIDNRLLMMLRKFRHTGHPELLEDGSLFVTSNKTAFELEAITEERITEYKHLGKGNTISPIRLSWLKTTLDSLSQFGNCILVRIPVHAKMKQLEEDSMPDFDRIISALSKECGIPYLNYIDLSGKLQSTDGNHLDRKSAIFFSRVLAEDIAGLIQIP